MNTSNLGCIWNMLEDCPPMTNILQCAFEFGHSSRLLVSKLSQRHIYRLHVTSISISTTFCSQMAIIRSPLSQKMLHHFGMMVSHFRMFTFKYLRHGVLLWHEKVQSCLEIRLWHDCGKKYANTLHLEGHFWKDAFHSGNIKVWRVSVTWAVSYFLTELLFHILYQSIS